MPSRERDHGQAEGSEPRRGDGVGGDADALEEQAADDAAAGARPPAGTADAIHLRTPRVTAETAAKGTRHPICCPVRVPAGTPSDSARGIPVMAIVMARPS